jgi:acetylornithine/succinyldiaminopimelate/putrescine aminotransferase
VLKRCLSRPGSPSPAPPAAVAPDRAVLASPAEIECGAQVAGVGAHPGKRLQAEALSRKLIVLTAGTYVNVVRIIPPLVTTAEEVDLSVSIINESLAAANA